MLVLRVTLEVARGLLRARVAGGVCGRGSVGIGAVLRDVVLAHELNIERFNLCAVGVADGNFEVRIAFHVAPRETSCDMKHALGLAVAAGGMLLNSKEMVSDEASQRVGESPP